MEIVHRLQRRTVTLIAGRLADDQPAGRAGELVWLTS
jgi:hypothetical protein